jgi:hypothetical protein
MRISIKIGLVFATLWMATKMIAYFLGMGADWYNTSAMLNNFTLLSAIGFGIYFTKKRADFQIVTFLEDVKAGIASGVVYTLIVASFSFMYLDQIDSSYLDVRIQERMTLVEEQLSTDSQLAEYKKMNTEAELKSREQIVAEIRETTEGILNPKVQFVFLLMGFLLLSVIYSLIVTVIIRKILLKNIN